MNMRVIQNWSHEDCYTYKTCTHFHTSHATLCTPFRWLQLGHTCSVSIKLGMQSATSANGTQKIGKRKIDAKISSTTAVMPHTIQFMAPTRLRRSVD